MPDFYLTLYGSIGLLHPLTATARLWCTEHINPSHEEWCGAIVIEHMRYVAPIIEGLESDGLVCSRRPS